MAGRVARAGWQVAKAADVEEPGNLVSCSVRLLGAVEVRCADWVIDLGPPKQRILLVALALSPNEIVSADRLIELMWGDDPPRTAAHSVQIYVSGLRKALAGLDAACIVQALAVDIDRCADQAAAVAQCELLTSGADDKRIALHLAAIVYGEYGVGHGGAHAERA